MHPGNIIFLASENVYTNQRIEEVQRKVNAMQDIRLSYIDAGMTATLEANDRKNFIDLFLCIIRNDGSGVGQLMMDKSRGDKELIVAPEQFKSEISQVLNEIHSSGLQLQKIGVGELLHKVLRLCYNHQVKLESRYISVVIAIGVLEGLGKRLDPEIDLLKLAAPYVMKAALL